MLKNIAINLNEIRENKENNRLISVPFYTRRINRDRFEIVRSLKH